MIDASELEVTANVFLCFYKHEAKTKQHLHYCLYTQTKRNVKCLYEIIAYLNHFLTNMFPVSYVHRLDQQGNILYYGK